MFNAGASPAVSALKAALHAADVQYLSFDLDARPDAEPLTAALARSTGQRAAPFVFVNGVYAGSLESVLKKLVSGDFARAVKPSGGPCSVVVVVDAAKVGDDGFKYIESTSAPLSAMPKSLASPLWARWPFFWFPYVHVCCLFRRDCADRACLRRYNVNAVTAQYTGVLVCAVSILCAVCAERWWCRVLITAMFGDFVLRILFAARGSFLGSIADAFAQLRPIRVTPGPPKQVIARVRPRCCVLRRHRAVS